jgi:cell volume regulation protein A
MGFTFDNILLIGSLLVIISVLASKSNKLGIPSMLLFLGVGMLAGSDGIGGIFFSDTHVSKLIGIIALILILFSGGLDTRYSDIKPIMWHGILLSTVGVLLTSIIVGIFVKLTTNLSIYEGLLLGSIISSTDASSVFTILRSKNSGLKGNIRPLLEFESGSNDPMAYFLTIFYIFLIQNQGSSFVETLPLFFKQFVLGGAFGILMGYGIHRIFARIKLDFDGLYSVLMLSCALFTFSFSDFIGGNGFLSVYLAAVILGNKEFIHKRSLTKHFDGQAWLMQIIMFLTLGLLVFPKQLLPLTGIGILIALFIIFVARPIAVFISLFPSNFNVRAKLFISWVGLRGAVPVILAIYALDAGIPNADLIFNLVFFISAISVLIQGTSIPWVARLLKLSVPVSIRKRSTLDSELANKVKSILIEIDVKAGYHCIDKSIIDLTIPMGNIISMIKRGDTYIQPEGNTIIREGDKLSILSDSVDALQNFYKNIGLHNQ